MKLCILFSNEIDSVFGGDVNENKHQQLGIHSQRGHTRVGIGQKWANREQYFTDSQSWTPLVFQYVETDTSIAIYVGVIYLCCEVHFGRFEWLQEELRENNEH